MMRSKASFNAEGGQGMFLEGRNEVSPDERADMSMDLSPAWARVRARLKAEIGEDVFSSWFGRMELVTLEHGVAHLTVPTRFLKSWIDSHYADRLRSHCQAELPFAEQIELSVRQTLSDRPRTPSALTPPPARTPAVSVFPAGAPASAAQAASRPSGLSYGAGHASAP
jgi:chromosomal replication initiator protein